MRMFVEADRMVPSTSMSTMVRAEGRACNSHSEAERQRRRRINDQLGRLRQLLPHTSRMDKASLLMEVVREVKELSRRTADVVGDNYGDGSWGPAFPGDSDEVVLGDGGGSGTATASVCCEDRTGLFADVGEALRSAGIRVARAEMATVGGRAKVVLLVDIQGTAEGGEHGRSALRSVLRSVLERPRGCAVGSAPASAKRVRFAQRGTDAASYHY